MHKSIPLSELEKGMFVVEYGQGTYDDPTVSIGEFFTTDEQIEKLRDHDVASVTIDTERRAPAPGEAFAAELGVLDKVFAKSVKYARTIMKDARLGRLTSAEGSSELVDEMIRSATKSPSSALFLSKLGDYDEYTYSHCVNVATIAVAFGGHLKLPQKTLHLLGLAGLFHDVGKALVPAAILNKPGKLTRAEFEVMRSHARKGLEVLRQVGDLPESVLLAACQHHERFDGTGYPDGLSGKKISPLAQILAVVDVYDAMTSKRVYHAGRPTTDVLRHLYTSRGHFAPGLVERFIKTLGVYPPGTLIKLDTGALALVCEPAPGHAARPLISLVHDGQGKLRAAPACTSLETAGKDGRPAKVAEVLDFRNYDIDISGLVAA